MMDRAARRRAAGAVLLAIAMALGTIVLTADGPEAVSGGLGGDYPAFYAAGELVLRDFSLDAARFYDPSTQFEAQAPVLPQETTGNLYFAYPAFFVAPFVVLANLGFELSYLVNVLAMVLAVVVALRTLRPCSRVIRDHGLETLAIALTFYPLFRGVTGGQNTALSLLAFAVIWRSLHDGRELPAGVAAGLLLFKPPLAIPILGLFLLRRHFVSVAAAGATAVGLYAVGAVLTDPSWLSAWIDAVRYLDRVDTPFNVHNYVSLPGVAEAIFGIDSTTATIIGYGSAAVVAVVMAFAWSRNETSVDIRIAVAVAGSLLISPHALYYDAGLLVLVGLVVAERRPDLRAWLAVLWAAGLLHLSAESLGVDPVVGVVLAGFALALVTEGSKENRSRLA